DPKVNASGGVPEENLRRLLQGTAPRPPEHLEARLLRAMPRAASQRRTARRFFRWSWPGAGLAPAWALGAALAATGMLVGCHLHRGAGPVSVKQPGGNGGEWHGPPPPPPVKPEPILIGYVLLPQGEMLCRPAGKEDWTAVEGGTALHLGDTLRTEADS